MQPRQQHPHLCLLCCLVSKQLALPDGVVQLCVGVAHLARVDEQLKPLGEARQGAVPAGRASREVGTCRQSAVEVHTGLPWWLCSVNGKAKGLPVLPINAVLWHGALQQTDCSKDGRMIVPSTRSTHVLFALSCAWQTADCPVNPASTCCLCGSAICMHGA